MKHLHNIYGRKDLLRQRKAENFSRKTVLFYRYVIIEYARQIKEEKLEFMFKGKNFVFDERLGERIKFRETMQTHYAKTQIFKSRFRLKELINAGN